MSSKLASDVYAQIIRNQGNIPKYNAVSAKRIVGMLCRKLELGPHRIRRDQLVRGANLEGVVEELEKLGFPAKLDTDGLLVSVPKPGKGES